MTGMTGPGLDVTAPSRRRDPRPRAARPRTAPTGVAIVGALALACLALPLLALILRTPWSDLAAIVTSPDALAALGLSLRTAAATTAISVVLGVPLAWLLARGALPFPALARTLVTLPMVLPPVVGGIALLALLGRTGLIGQYLHGLGITIPFTTLAVVLAQTFVAMPFLVLSLEGAMRGRERTREEIAATLGASPWYIFRRVTIPVLAPALIAGSVLCFARALGEFGATITFAGNFPGTTQTMPIAIYLAREQDQSAAIALSMLLMVTSALILVLLRSRWLPGLRGKG